MKILSVNAGSSSLKFTLYEMPEEELLISGYIEKIGLKDSFWTTKINGKKIKGEKPLKNHKEAVQVLIDELLNNKVVESLDEIKGIGHRVLHGGEKYSDSVIITDEVKNKQNSHKKKLQEEINQIDEALPYIDYFSKEYDELKERKDIILEELKSGNF